jgi:hypothetical protein
VSALRAEGPARVRAHGGVPAQGRELMLGRHKRPVGSRARGNIGGGHREGALDPGGDGADAGGDGVGWPAS